MPDAPKPRLALASAAVRPPAGPAEGAPAFPRPPGHLGLRRAAEMVEGAAFDLARDESPVFISRLIEIAAELERLSRADGRSERGASGAKVFRLD